MPHQNIRMHPAQQVRPLGADGDLAIRILLPDELLGAVGVQADRHVHIPKRRAQRGDGDIDDTSRVLIETRADNRTQPEQ